MDGYEKEGIEKERRETNENQKRVQWRTDSVRVPERANIEAKRKRRKDTVREKERKTE